MSFVIVILILLALTGANLPWLTDRFFIFFDIPKKYTDKTEWMRILEWLVFYFLIGLLSIGLEIRSVGERHDQDWEFYAITFFMFVIFAMPGYVYFHFFRGKS